MGRLSRLWKINVIRSSFLRLIFKNQKKRLMPQLSLYKLQVIFFTAALTFVSFFSLRNIELLDWGIDCRSFFSLFVSFKGLHLYFVWILCSAPAQVQVFRDAELSCFRFSIPEAFSTFKKKKNSPEKNVCFIYF